MKSSFRIEYYVTVVLIWIMLLLGMYYMYLQLSSTLFWNQKIETLYETFVVKKSNSSGSAPSSFLCTFKQLDDGKGMSFGCAIPELGL
jgi:hypothetical protein